MSQEHKISRRTFVKAGAVGAGLVATACQPKVVEKIVERTVVVTQEKVVEQTVVVKEAVEVQKEVTRVVEKVVEPAKKPVVLRLHMRAGGETSEIPIYVTRPKEFTEETGIQVKLEPTPGGEYWAKIEALAVAGDLGDNIFTTEITWNHSRMVHFAILAPIDDYMESEGVSRDEWLPGAIGTCTYGGKTYGLPKCAHSGYPFIWINHALFEKAGIPIPPTYGSTFDEHREWANKLASGPADQRDVYGYFPVVNALLAAVQWTRTFGGFLLDEAGTQALVDTEPFKEWVIWNYNLLQKDKTALHVSDAGSAGALGMFAAGKLAMFHSSRGGNGQIRQAVGPEDGGGAFKWSCIGLPEGPKFESWPASLNAHAPTMQSQHKLESFKLQYALADARFAYLVANEQGYLVGRKNELSEIGEAAKDRFIQIQYRQDALGVPFRKGRNFRGVEFQSTLVNTLDEVFLGTREPDDAFFSDLKVAADDVLSRPVP